MARELEGYREMRAWFAENYPGLALFNQKKAAKVLGCTPRTAKAKYGIDADGIGLHDLCQLVCRAKKKTVQRGNAVRR